MKTKPTETARELDKLIDRTPFRPFTVRVSSGGQYQFPDRRSVGMGKESQLLWHFGTGGENTMIVVSEINEIVVS